MGEFQTEIDRTLTLTDRKGAQRDLTDDEIERAIAEIQATIKRYRTVTMRSIILDTETTGLDPKQGHRLIEIAAVEVVDRRLTGRNVHFYVNPEREIDAGATDVHGMTWDMLRDKPRFGDVAREFIDFATGARWIIHNAPFDLAFLDEELRRLDLPSTASVCARSHRYAGAGARAIPGQEEQSRCAVRAIRRRRRAARACTARCSTRACWPRSTWR